MNEAADIPPAEILHAIERGYEAMLREKADGLGRALARQWEEEILEGLPLVCQWVKSDIDELAKRKEATKKSYRRRFAKFVRWAAERGFIRLPYDPAVVAHFFIDEANRGVAVNQIKVMRTAIQACHEEQGFAAPCRDPLVRAIIRLLDMPPPDDGGGGQPVPEQQKAA